VFGHSAITPFLGGTLGLYIVPSTSTSHSRHLHPTLDIYIQISTSSSTSYSRHQHLTLYISILPSTSSSTSYSQPRRLTLEPQFDYLVVDPYISLSTSSSTSYSRHQHLTLDIYISLSKLTWLSSRLHLYISSRYKSSRLHLYFFSISTSYSRHLHLTLDIYISLPTSSSTSYSRHLHLTLVILISLSKLNRLSICLHLFRSIPLKRPIRFKLEKEIEWHPKCNSCTGWPRPIGCPISWSPFHKRVDDFCWNRGVYSNPKHSIGECLSTMFTYWIHTPIQCIGFEYTPLFQQSSLLWSDLVGVQQMRANCSHNTSFFCTSTSHSQHLHQHHTLDIYISLLTFTSHSRNSIDYLFVYTSFFCTSTSFFDGYCSTVQGLLDWFEVDSGFTELSFIQIDLNVVCVFVLYSRVSLSSCPFWTFCTASPARWECL